MKINYWDCKFSEADEYYNEVDDDWYWVYGCTYKDNPSRICPYENKYNDDEVECSWAKLINGQKDE